LQHEKNGVRLISWSPSSGEESLMLPEMSTALSTNDLRQLAMIMEPLCNSYCAQDRIKDAEAVSRQVLRMRESACGQDSEEVRGSMAQLAYVHMAGSEYDAAIEIYNKLLDSDLGSVRMRADSLLSRALCYDITGKADAAAADFKKARRLYKEYLKTSPDDMRIQWLVEDVDYQLVRKSSFGVRGKDYLAAVDRHLWKKEQSPLKVYIDDSSDTGFDAPLRARLKTAFQQWLPENSKMWLQYTAVDNADEANIVIARVDNFDDLPSGAGGQTTYEYNEEGNPASGVKKVIIRMFCASPAADQLTARTIDRLYSLCLHEIGHALGLDGHSPNGQDIMYWKAPGLQLSARDTATLAKLYRK
jgi:tetratricopeptide (TPR) repeat protein